MAPSMSVFYIDKWCCFGLDAKCEGEKQMTTWWGWRSGRSGSFRFLPLRGLSIFHSGLSEGEISLCIGIRRIKLRGAVEVLGSISIVTELRESYAQIVMGVSVSGIEAERLVEGFNGFRDAMHFKKSAADFVVDLGLTGLESERKTELIEGLLLESLMVKDCA